MVNKWRLTIHMKCDTCAVCVRRETKTEYHSVHNVKGRRRRGWTHRAGECHEHRESMWSVFHIHSELVPRQSVFAHSQTYPAWELTELNKEHLQGFALVFSLPLQVTGYVWERTCWPFCICGFKAFGVY